jgi:hypothetical protein
MLLIIVDGNEPLEVSNENIFLVMEKTSLHVWISYRDEYSFHQVFGIGDRMKYLPKA